jgi:protein subunit release factor A
VGSIIFPYGYLTLRGLLNIGINLQDKELVKKLREYTQNSEVIKELNEVIKNESDGQVVRTAIESVRTISEVKAEEEKGKLLAAEKAELKPRSKKIELLEKHIVQK